MKIAVYPFGEIYDYLIDAILKENKQMELAYLIRPHTWNSSEKYKKYEKNFEEFSDLVTSIDELIILESELYFKSISLIKCAIENGTRICCCEELNKEDLLGIQERCKQHNCVFTYYGDKDYDINTKINMMPHRFYPQQYFVIVVTPIFQNLSTDKTTVELKNLLEDKGYRVTCLTTSNNLQILNYEVLPVQAINCASDESVYQWNQYFEWIQRMMNPEICIVQMPTEGLFRASGMIQHGYGVQTYLISQALYVDYCILQTCYTNLLEYNDISDELEKRLGYSVDSIVVSDVCVDEEESYNLESVTYQKEEMGHCEEYCKDVVENNKAISVIGIENASTWNDIVENVISK